MENKLTWTDFYIKLANRLAEYHDKREELIIKLRAIYLRLGMRFPRLEEGDEIYDIDPFTVFGFFNKGISKETRLAIIRELKADFNIEANEPVDFDGVPVFNNMSSVCFRHRDERGPNDIENLWQVFLAALVFADSDGKDREAEFRHYYDLALRQRGIKWNLSMALFWIRPYYFINLDSRNRWYISKYAVTNMSAELIALTEDLREPPRAEQYIEICKAAREMTSHHDSYHSLPELSNSAWSDAMMVDSLEEADNRAAKDTEVRYWSYSPGRNAEFWEEFYNDGVMAIGWSELGDLNQYPSREAMRQKMISSSNDEMGSQKNASLATWQFVHTLKPGDVIIAKQGQKKILGRGIVESDYFYDENRNGYHNVRKVKWTHKGDWDFPELFATKTLTDITPYSSYIDGIKKIFEDEELGTSIEDPEVSKVPYSETDFLSEVYIDEEDFKHIAALLDRKKNIILEGAPGTGKTFAAKRLAYAIMGEKDTSRVQMVQFHQSYSYEDFIEGYRPNSENSGFTLTEGIFCKFCKMARDDFENKYFFIIDEINRGNLSKIFGELLMLIENDKRNEELPLLYSKNKFSVPKNVYIIGLMNTADRSLANIEYALRRRFAFFEMEPGFETDGFKKYQSSLNSQLFDDLIEKIKILNTKIAEDDGLGRGYRIGHSYFCNSPSDEDLPDIIEYEIKPLLNEYWFDEPEKCKAMINLFGELFR